MNLKVVIVVCLIAVVSCNPDYDTSQGSKSTTWNCYSKDGETKMDCYAVPGPGTFDGDEADQSGRGRSMNQGACQLPQVVGRCRGSIPRFYYDKASGSCQEFSYGGCGGNDNNFENEGDCRTTCEARGGQGRVAGPPPPPPTKRPGKATLGSEFLGK